MVVGTYIIFLGNFIFYLFINCRVFIDFSCKTREQTRAGSSNNRINKRFLCVIYGICFFNNPKILLSQTNAQLIFLATCFRANIYNFTENIDKNIIGWRGYRSLRASSSFGASCVVLLCRLGRSSIFELVFYFQENENLNAEC